MDAFVFRCLVFISVMFKHRVARDYTTSSMFYTNRTQYVDLSFASRFQV